MIASIFRSQRASTAFVSSLPLPSSFSLPSSSSSVCRRGYFRYPRNISQRHSIAMSSSTLTTPVESVAGKQPVFAQTMLRINDPTASIAFYESLGLKYVATMAFPEYKFSLYFLIAPDATSPKPPPIDSPRDVVSKFLWACRCPTLELTHNWPSEGEAPEKFVSGNEPPFGYGHLALSGMSGPPGVADSYGPSHEEKISSIVTDPDGYAVKIINASAEKNVTYARTMLRIHDPEKMVCFFERLGMVRLAVIKDSDEGIDHYFMGYCDKNDIPSEGINDWITNLQAPVVHLRHNWKTPEETLVNGNEKPNRGFGHLGIIVDDVYSLMKNMEELGYSVVRKPSPFLDVGDIAFIKDDDMTGYWIEIIGRSNEADDKAASLSMNTEDLRGYKVVLGTTSKWRRALFQQHFANVAFAYAAADIDEKAIGSRQLPPAELTDLIANAKADALLEKFEGTKSLLLTLDQVVLGKSGEILEKPADANEARKYLGTYDAEHPVTAVTAAVVTECMSGKRVSAVDTASLVLEKLPEDVIEKLIEKGDVLYSAGGITVEDELVVPFHGKLTGELESILGLPVKTTARLLKEGAELYSE